MERFYFKISVERLRGFSDGVMAIAITLLILSIDVPPMHKAANSQQLLESLINLLPNVTSYIISFLLIAKYWKLQNFVLHDIKTTDNGLIWLTMLFLLSLSVLPFPTGLVGSYQHIQLAVILFDIFVSMPAIILALTTLYLLKSNRYRDELSFEEAHIERAHAFIRLLFIIPLVGLLSVAVSFYSTAMALYTWSILIIIFFLTAKYGKKIPF